MLSSALLDQPQCLDNLASKRFYISNKKVPSSTESAMITEITEFTQITGTNDLNLTVMQILMLKIVFICIVSGVTVKYSFKDGFFSPHLGSAASRPIGTVV